MEKAAILAELRALAATVPDFQVHTPSSGPHHEWLGKLHALVMRWDKHEASSIKMATAWLTGPVMREAGISDILSGLHRAIADLEIQVGALPPQAFGPGAVYDFMKTLRELVGSATNSLFVVDPYLDHQVFDSYLSSVSTAVSTRLLVRKAAPGLKGALSAFVAQKKMAVEIRVSPSIHDRVIFLDDRSCWVLGQSIKDAAKSTPTYIAPVSIDVSHMKKQDYDEIWLAAAPL
jgi:hypothetical protein